MGQRNTRPISKHAQRQIRRDEELQIHLTVQRMENFIMLAYMVGNKKHSIALILYSAMARSRFSEFVVQDRCSYDLYVLCEIVKMQEDPYMSLFKRAKELYDTHLKPMNDKRKFVPVAFLTREKVAAALVSTNLNDLRSALTQAVDDIVGGLAASVWIRFVQSKIYANWRCQERAHACSMTIEDLNFFANPPAGDENIVMSSCETVRRVHSESTVKVPEDVKLVKTNTKRVIPQQQQQRTKGQSVVSLKRGIFESPTSELFHLFSKKDSNVYFRPSVLKYDPVIPLTKMPIQSLDQKKRLFPSAEDLNDMNRSRADNAYKSLSSMAPLELLNLMNSGSQWLVMFLAGIEAVPLCVSLHSPEYYRGSKIAFPYFYANKYHESVFNIDRNDLVGESINVLFDSGDSDVVIAGDSENASVRLRTTVAGAMPDIYMGLVRGMPSIFCRMVNPLLETGGNLLSIVGADGGNESFDPTAETAAGADILNAVGVGDESSVRSAVKYSGLVVGVKPIFASDKNTIIAVVCVQQKINAKEKWMQGYKYIEDMLALIPEECDIREYEGSYNFAYCASGGKVNENFAPPASPGSPGSPSPAGAPDEKYQQ